MHKTWEIAATNKQTGQVKRIDFETDAEKKAVEAMMQAEFPKERFDLVIKDKEERLKEETATEPKKGAKTVVGDETQNVFE